MDSSKPGSVLKLPSLELWHRDAGFSTAKVADDRAMRDRIRGFQQSFESLETAHEHRELGLVGRPKPWQNPNGCQQITSRPHARVNRGGAHEDSGAHAAWCTQREVKGGCPGKRSIQLGWPVLLKRHRAIFLGHTASHPFAKTALRMGARHTPFLIGSAKSRSPAALKSREWMTTINKRPYGMAEAMPFRTSRQSTLSSNCEVVSVHDTTSPPHSPIFPSPPAPSRSLCPRLRL